MISIQESQLQDVINADQDRPDPPTLAQIKAGVQPIDGWYWTVHLNGTVEAMEQIIRDKLDAAYEAGRRHAHDVEHAANMQYADTVIAQQKIALERQRGVADQFRSAQDEIADLIKTAIERSHHITAIESENSGLRAEIARLRAGKPEPVRHVAGPNLAARWEDGRR